MVSVRITYGLASPNMECSIYFHISENMEPSQNPGRENMERPGKLYHFIMKSDPVPMSNLPAGGAAAPLEHLHRPQKICLEPQIPKFRIWPGKCFPPHPMPKQSFPTNLDLGLTPTQNNIFWASSSSNRAWGKLLGHVQNLCPTNINDFKHSVNALPRVAANTTSHIARVLLAPCLRAVRARSTSRPPRVALALRGPALRGPAHRGPADRGPAVRSPAVRSLAVRSFALPYPRRPWSRRPWSRRPCSHCPCSRDPCSQNRNAGHHLSLFSWETPDAAEAQKWRGKGLCLSDDENLALCRAKASVSQDTVRDAGMRQA
jgi:hypothetical protein